MKNKKTWQILRNAKAAVEQANQALESVMQELDDETMDQVSGGGNPFEDIPRVPTQPIGDEPRNNG